MSDDLRYQFGSPRPPRRPSPAGVWTVVAAFALLVGVGAAYYFKWRRPQPEATRPAAAPSTTAPRAAEPGLEPALVGPAVALPRLDESDAFVRERLGALSGDAEWGAWLAADGLVRRFVAAVSAVSEGKSPRQVLDRIAIRGPFTARPRGGRLVVDASSFARYDRVAAVLAALDAKAARPLWRLLRPLAGQAWAEIAPPGDSLDAALARALDHLLATPLPPAEVEVYLDGVLYRYADPEYESLTAAQKHLFRMGQVNAARVQAALRGLRPLVGD